MSVASPVAAREYDPYPTLDEASAGRLDRAAREEPVARMFERQIVQGLRQVVAGADWEQVARPAQLPPGHPRASSSRTGWTIWLNLSGRAVGKTRSGAEWTFLRRRQGYGRRIALIGQTASDVRTVMIEGVSGILACAPEWDRPKYEPSKRQLVWPDGSIAQTFYGDTPGQLRGPQFDTVWIDEFAKFKRPAETLANAEMALRLSDDPLMYISTTPVPRKELRDLLADPDVEVTQESTFANEANLPARFIARMRRKYEGTRIGRQELYGVLLEDVEGALWTGELIERHRGVQQFVDGRSVWTVYDWEREQWRLVPRFALSAVGVDPAFTMTATSDNTGIVGVSRGEDEHGYVRRDDSGKYPPEGWGSAAIKCYDAIDADFVTAERNRVGDLVESVLRLLRPSVPYQAVLARTDKHTRAHPVATLAERGRHHLLGTSEDFAELEEQMTSYVPGGVLDEDTGRRRKQDSPNNMDAMVWASLKLLVDEGDLEWGFR